jgi:hypothetical protein
LVLALAVAAAAGRGYYQTIFTRHAPSIQTRIAEFDEEFKRILGEVDPKESRQQAIEQIAGMLESPLPDRLPYEFQAQVRPLARTAAERAGTFLELLSDAELVRLNKKVEQRLLSILSLGESIKTGDGRKRSPIQKKRRK